MEDAIEGKLLERGVTLSSNIIGGYKTYKCVVPLSGGKDSQACLVLALRRFLPSEILALFCDTQFEVYEGACFSIPEYHKLSTHYYTHTFS